jgi:hypothetical protein
MGLLVSCGGEEIQECVGVAVGDPRDDLNCTDCCQRNGFKRGIVSTSSGSTTRYSCRCSGEADD